MTDATLSQSQSATDHRPAVATARCITYHLEAVRAVVELCVAALPDLQAALGQARRVLVKPNLLSSTRGPDSHVNTHPAVVQAVAELLMRDFGCHVAIGDSCGTFSRKSTARALEISGMAEVARTIGADLYNVDAQPRHVVPCPDSRIFKEITLPANLDEFDLIVSVSKLKTHLLTYVTGPVKNLFGLVPGAAKKQAHVLAPRPHEFATLLCDLYAAVRPVVAFVDGIIGMEGRGPGNGPLRHVEMIAASADPVAADALCAQVMGFRPQDVPLLAECQARGLGMADPAGFTVLGEPAAAFALPDFAKPSTFAAAPLGRLVPRWAVRTMLRVFATRYAHIEPDLCRRCGACERECPSEAIYRDRKTHAFRVDRRKCISCYCCAEACPYDAVRVEGTMPTKALGLLRAVRRRLRRA